MVIMVHKNISLSIYIYILYIYIYYIYIYIYDSEPINNDKYIKTKINSYNTNKG